MSIFKRKFLAPRWQQYLSMLSGDVNQIVLAIVVSAAQAGALLAALALVRQIFDNALVESDVALLIRIGAAMLAMYFSSALLSVWGKRIAIVVSERAARGLRTRLLDQLYAFSRSQFTKLDRGVLHANLVEDTDRVRIMTDALMINFLPSLFITLVISILLLYLNPTLFAALVIVVPLIALLIRRFGMHIRRKIQRFHRSFEEFSKGAWFALRMMDLTKTLAADEAELRTQTRHVDSLATASRQMHWLSSIYRTSQDLLITVAGLIVLILGGLGVISGWISLGEMLTFYVALALLSKHLSNFLGALTYIYEGSESMDSIYALLGSAPDPVYPGGRELDFHGAVELSGISFSYQSARAHDLIQNCDLRIEPGQTTLLIGDNGSGKTTIVNLILGFYRPQEGELLADGTPYSEWQIESLRRQIGVVPQNPLLFSGSVKQNIVYPLENVAEKELDAACRQADALDFIEALAAGFDTQIGEDALFLSGGQRQRLAIARALLHRPRLLIMDEPTNHLEIASVDTLMRNLKNLDYSPSIFLISHDAKLPEYADVCYQLVNGSTQEMAPVSGQAMRE